MRTLTGVALLCIVCAGRSSAQIPLVDQLFSNAKDVNTGFGGANLLGGSVARNHWMPYVVFEVTLDLGEVGCLDLTRGDGNPDFCKDRRDQEAVAAARLKECALDSKALSDSACAAFRAHDVVQPATVVRQIRAGDTTTTTTYQSTRSGDSLLPKAWDVEVGFSYGRISGLATHRAGLQLSGNVEEFPVISAYLTSERWRRFQPYLGVRAGFAKLNSVRGYIGDTMFVATGNTHLLGTAVGGAVRIGGNVYAYGETDITWRNFSTVEWTPRTGTSTIPAVLPRSMRFSTGEAMIGVQLNLKSP